MSRENVEAVRALFRAGEGRDRVFAAWLRPWRRIDLGGYKAPGGEQPSAEPARQS